MNNRRKCHKCGKVRVCRVHRQGTQSCKNYIQALCLKCQRQLSKEWYELNKERKKQYQRNYHNGITVGNRKSIGLTRQDNQDFLNALKKTMKWTNIDKLRFIFL